ncbi:MAG: hypothetical protein WAW96_01595 [Alphaproteobacteria bacterium]
MRWALAMTAVSLMVGATAHAADVKFTCSRGDTVRSVAVVSQPDSGHSCEVQYEKTSMGEKPEVLWHADSGMSFCADQAKALAARLRQAGWTCAQGETAAIASERAPQPYAVPVEVGGPVKTDAPNTVASGVTAAVRPATPAPKFQLRPTLH